jgi:hypothetical protein
MARMIRTAFGAVMASVFVFAAAADTPRFVTTTGPTYDEKDFDMYLAGRDARLVVRGDPFGMGNESFDRAVASLLPNRRRGQTTNFTTVPGADAVEGARLVFLFNPASIGNDPCSAKGYKADPRPREITLSAAWCPGSQAAMHLTGYLGGATGVDDAGFRALVAETMLELFPSNNPENFMNEAADE